MFKNLKKLIICLVLVVCSAKPAEHKQEWDNSHTALFLALVGYNKAFADSFEKKDTEPERKHNHEGQPAAPSVVQPAQQPQISRVGQVAQPVVQPQAPQVQPQAQGQIPVIIVSGPAQPAEKPQPQVQPVQPVVQQAAPQQQIQSQAQPVQPVQPAQPAAEQPAQQPVVRAEPVLPVAIAPAVQLRRAAAAVSVGGGGGSADFPKGEGKDEAEGKEALEGDGGEYGDGAFIIEKEDHEKFYNAVLKLINLNDDQTMQNGLNELSSILCKNIPEKSPLMCQQFFIDNYKLLKKLIKQIMGEYTKNPSERLKFEQLIIFIDEFYKSGPWSQGKIVLQAILTNNVQNFKKSNEEYIKNIVYLMWYFYEMASNKNQKFAEGTFNLLDAKNGNKIKLIFDFINSYHLKYDRSGNKSSHYHEIKKEKYGIDIPNEAGNEMRKILCFPNAKYHILFGVLYDEPFQIFIKPETYGIKTWGDFYAHGWEYAESVKRKLAGGNDAHDMRKEHLKKEIEKAWKAYFETFEYDARRSELDKRVSKEGIKGIVEALKDALFYPESVEQQQAKNRLKMMIQSYNEREELLYRKGNEVIITMSDIEKSLRVK